MIQFVNVTKTYGELKALDNVSFEIVAGEMVFLVGLSGAGKSTILRLLYREEKPTSGQVFVSNVDVSRLPNNQTPLLRRRMGVIFQDFKLLPSKTCFENIAYPLFAIGMDSLDIKKKVHVALKVVGLTNKANDFPKNLSGGEQQRVDQMKKRVIILSKGKIVSDVKIGTYTSQVQ